MRIGSGIVGISIVGGSIGAVSGMGSAGAISTGWGGGISGIGSGNISTDGAVGGCSVAVTDGAMTGASIGCAAVSCPMVLSACRTGLGIFWSTVSMGSSIGCVGWGSIVK